VDDELDQLTAISRSGKQVIAEMEDGERKRTGISSLKVGKPRVRYYIECRSRTSTRSLATICGNRTIAGGERYITPA
jgi:DNA mismatch repair protein MutS